MGIGFSNDPFALFILKERRSVTECRCDTTYVTSLRCRTDINRSKRTIRRSQVARLRSPMVPHMNLKTQFRVWLALAGLTLLADAQQRPAETRGEQLYSTHCVACHTTQMHWRNDRQAFDWESLKFQVCRWPGNAGLAWNDADIAKVSRYLNETIYHYPQINDRVGMVSSGTVQSAPRK